LAIMSLGLGQLQEALALLEVRIGLVVVVIGDVLGLHVLRQVGALAAHSTDDHHSGVGELLGVIHELAGVLVCRGLGQGPVLGEHFDLGAVCTVLGIEVAQLFVGLQTG